MSQQASSEKRDLSQFRDLILDSYMKEENIQVDLRIEASL